MPYFLLLWQNYFHFLCAFKKIWDMEKFETSILKLALKSASTSKYYWHYMFAKFLINCLQELGVYSFWTVKVLIQAEASMKPRGKLERERKNHI